MRVGVLILVLHNACVHLFNEIILFYPRCRFSQRRHLKVIRNAIYMLLLMLPFQKFDIELSDRGATCVLA